jgi:hypothetical protein
MMKLRHKEPCAECPWRKKSPAGWLGGVKDGALYYADALGNNELPPCHLNDHGPDNPKSSFCVGALAVTTNQCVQPWKTPGAMEAAKIIGRRDDCFGHVGLFYKHHTGTDYVNPFMR